MTIEGPLRELGIHDVFQLLDLSRKTGVLRVTSDLRNNAGTIFFEDGAIVYAEIRSNPHPLGSLLVRTGRVNDADLERARDMQVRGGDRRRIGEILVELGVVTPRELQRQVRFQIEEVVFEVMGWREGYFSFTEGPLSEVPAESAVRIPTEALLMEGARRIDEWARIEKRLPHLGVVPAFAAAQAGSEGDLDLLPPEWEVLALIDGQRDVRGVAAALGRSDFGVAKTLFGLESAGLVVITDPRTPPGARCDSTRCSRPPTGTSDTPWWRAVGSPKRSNSGTSGSGSLPGWTRSSGRSRRCGAPRGRRRCWLAARGFMADEVKTLSTQLARDPHSLVFLRLGELLRQKRQLDAARRVALIGLERHPHLADAHDPYARIPADRHDND